MKNLDHYIRQNRKSFETMLAELVEIPTVSADPGHLKNIRKGVKVAQEFLRSFGAKTEVVPTRGNPVVLGRFDIPGARKTVTIYNHLDVQPATEPEWRREPFVFRKHDGKYYGRGSTDDKGPALTALFAARYAAEQRIPVNIQFIWETEEEIGSPHFADALKAKQSALKTDTIVVIDSVWISAKNPCIYYALRGGITASMTLETSGRDVHSGVTGGVAVNPILELCKVASALHDTRSGKVLIPGFYEGIMKPGRTEWKHLLQSGFQLKQWAKSYELKELQVQDRKSAIERLWCLPTFDVHGVVGGYTGPGIKSAIPSRAELKFSCRLAPNQDPNKMANLLMKQIRKLNPRVKVQIHAKILPYWGRFDGLYSKIASHAFQYGFSRKPVFARAGGSDGAIILLNEYLKAHVNLMGLSLPEHGYHAPNEYYEWRQVKGGIRTLAKYFEQVSKLEE